MKTLRLYLSKYQQLPVQLKASVWFFICAFLQKAVAMISTPIFTRLMTTTEYGQYNVFNSWMDIIGLLVSLCLYGGVYMQGLVKFEERRALFSSSIQTLTLALVLVWSAVYAAGYRFWNGVFCLSTTQMVCMFLLIWLSAVFSFWSSEQRVDYKYRTLVTVCLIAAVLQPLVGILFVVASADKVTARIVGLVLVDFICFSWMFWCQIRRGKYKISLGFWKYALLFNIPLVPHYLSQVVLNNSDRIMIGKMIGDSQAGIYSLAYSVALIMSLFNIALRQTLDPWIYQQIKAKQINKLAPVVYSALIFVAGVNLCLIMCAPEVVAFFAPPSYYQAIWIIPPVTMSVYLIFCYDIFAKFAFYYEKTVYIMTASVIGAAANIVLNFWLLPVFGYIAAGYTTLLCYLLYVVFHYVFMNKICNTYCDNARPYRLQTILRLTGIFFLLSFMVLFTYHYNPLRYGAILILAVVCLQKRRAILSFVYQLKAQISAKACR